MSKDLTEFESDPYSLFIFGFNSPSTKEKSVPRLNTFFDFIGIKLDDIHTWPPKKKETRGKPLVWIPSADQPDPKFFTGTVDGKEYIGEPIENLKKNTKQPTIQEFREVTGL